jgi:aryl-alcohol dehydrogenase-like predicted oxidoreductase
MKYNRLGQTDLFISAVGLGGWPFGGGYDWGELNEKDATLAVETALEQGINWVDTAPVYGNGASESFLGKVLRGKREKILLATKCGLVKNGSWTDHDLSPNAIRKQLEDSLLRLQTDFIDLYQIHYPDPKVPLQETLKELVRLKEAGKVRHIGVSNFTAEELLTATNLTEIAAVQNEYSLLHPQKGNQVFSVCRERGVGFIGYGTLCGGILSGKYKKEPNLRRADARNYFYKSYRGAAFDEAQQVVKRIKTMAKHKGVSPAEVAIGWALSVSAVSSVLIGARTKEQILQNIKGGDILFSSQELAYLEGRVCSCIK